MERFYQVARTVRNGLGCRPSIKRRARRMDPTIRQALATTLDGNQEARAMEELEAEVQEAKKLYEDNLAKEVFIGQRTAKYRAALDERAKQLKEERVSLSEKQPPDWEERMEAWERDEDTLRTVMDQHKEMIANCETMRRRIEELEERQETLREQQQEVEDFCQVAAQNREEEERLLVASGIDLDENGQDPNSLEEGVSAVEESPAEGAAVDDEASPEEEQHLVIKVI